MRQVLIINWAQDLVARSWGLHYNGAYSINPSITMTLLENGDDQIHSWVTLGDGRCGERVQKCKPVAQHRARIVGIGASSVWGPSDA